MCFPCMFTLHVVKSNWPRSASMCFPCMWYLPLTDCCVPQFLTLFIFVFEFLTLNTGTSIGILSMSQSDFVPVTDRSVVISGWSVSSWVALMVNDLPAMQETWVQSLGREDPLEKEMATHSTIFAWEPHGWRSLVGYSLWGCKESDITEQLTHSDR